MRKIIWAAFMNLDGVIQAPGARKRTPTDVFNFGDAIGQALVETYGQSYDPLLGRKTYEIFAAYWP